MVYSVVLQVVDIPNMNCLAAAVGCDTNISLLYCWLLLLGETRRSEMRGKHRAGRAQPRANNQVS